MRRCSNTIGYVVFRYGRLTSRNLVNLTHSEDPWLRADEHRAPGTSARIEFAWLHQYFSSDADDAGPYGITLEVSVVERWLAGAPDRRQDLVVLDSLDELRRRADAS